MHFYQTENIIQYENTFCKKASKMQPRNNPLIIFAVNTAKILVDIPYFIYCYIKIVIVAIFRSVFKKRKRLENEIILVTGAASGLGREVVLKLAGVAVKKGIPNKVCFVLWDINEEGLRETEGICRKWGVENVHSFKVDLTKREEIEKNAEIVRRNVGTVTTLFNNAGLSPYKTFLTIDPNLEENVIKVNLLSYMWTIREFLPGMLQNKKGHLICTCSGLGFYRFSHLSAYCASKYGLRGFLESLKLELRLMNKDDKDLIKFSTIYPGFVRTPMTAPVTWKPRYKNVRALEFLDVGWVAKEIVDGILKEKEEIFVPGSVSVLKWFYSFMPSQYVDKMEQRLMRNLNCENDVTCDNLHELKQVVVDV